METRLLDATNPATQGAAISEAAAMLERSEVVAFPTETVYGLGASAIDAIAIAKVFEVKGRPRGNPLIVHVADVEGIDAIAHVNDRVLALAERFMPGPLTLVLTSRE